MPEAENLFSPSLQQPGRWLQLSSFEENADFGKLEAGTKSGKILLRVSVTGHWGKCMKIKVSWVKAASSESVISFSCFQVDV